MTSDQIGSRRNGGGRDESPPAAVLTVSARGAAARVKMGAG
jgi:hypothetical protein